MTAFVLSRRSSSLRCARSSLFAPLLRFSVAPRVVSASVVPLSCHQLLTQRMRVTVVARSFGDAMCVRHVQCSSQRVYAHVLGRWSLESLSTSCAAVGVAAAPPTPFALFLTSSSRDSVSCKYSVFPRGLPSHSAGRSSLTARFINFGSSLELHISCCVENASDWKCIFFLLRSCTRLRTPLHSPSAALAVEVLFRERTEPVGPCCMRLCVGTGATHPGRVNTLLTTPLEDSHDATRCLRYRAPRITVLRCTVRL